MGWYLVITEDMRAAGLTGNALLIYALIHGYSQGEQGCYYGSLAHTSEVIGCTGETARALLKKMTGDGLLERFEFMENGNRRVAYRTTQKIMDTKKIWEDPPKNLGTTPQKIWDNNKRDSKDIEKTTYNSARPRFIPPTIEEVTAYCRERNNGISAESFIDYYTANGWKVGGNPMRDWKAAVRTWEARRKERPTPRAPRPSEERRHLSPEERTMAALARLQARDGMLHTFDPDEQ